MLPSTVTWPSSITSRSEDWVLGEVRFISSARTSWLIIRPCLYSSSPVLKLTMEKPVMSEGVMSGVNCMRLNEQSSERAIADTSVVLPTPGTSSISTWPRQSSAMKSSSTASCLPTTTRPTFCCNAPMTRRGSCIRRSLLYYMYYFAKNRPCETAGRLSAAAPDMARQIF